MYAVTGEWGELTLTGANDDLVWGDLLDTQLNCAAGSTYEFDVSSFVTGDGTYTLGIKTDTDVSGLKISSRESGEATAPTLIVTSASSNYSPLFSSDPIAGSDATEDASYNSSIADDASDPNSDPLSFSKVSGPAWLNVASDGTLSGTPNNSDVGANAFVVEADDGNGGTATAVLNITVVNVNNASAYEVWKTNYGITDDLADDDNDGIANMLEFALGGNPKSADAESRGPTVSRNGSVFEFIFYRGEASLDYTVESSLDLDRWESLAAVDDSHGLVGSVATVLVPDSQNGSSTVFLRLKVEN